MSLEPELFRALGSLCEPPDPEHAGLADALGLSGAPDRADFTELFVLQLVPYASVYLGADGMLGGEAGDRVAGFWRALHLTPPTEPDHLAVLLGLYAAIGEQEVAEPDAARSVLWREARRALLWEHLLTWVPAYTRAVRRTAGPCYAGWARMVADALLAEAESLPAPATPPVHFRDAAGPPAWAGELDPLVRGLLAPARSGVLLTRAQLARGARHVGVGLRLGDRAFVLRSMISQEPEATLGWLVDEADDWARWHRTTEPVLGAMARAWRIRAEATRAALVRARRTATEAATVG